MWDIIGHEWAVRVLQRVVRDGRPAHAYLFLGPPSVGKATVAQTFARALLCTAKPKDERPCGLCRPCTLVQAGQHPDVHIIEPERSSGDRKDKRDISIEQVRSFQHQASLRPYEGAYTIGLILDAQQMSDAAANALLKTLEEPPPHVVVMLTAPTAETLLPTIVSRCQVFALRPLPVHQVEEALRVHWNVEPSTAHILAHISQGRLGWAVSAIHETTLQGSRRRALDDLIRLVQAGRSERLAVAEGLSAQFVRDLEGRQAVITTLELWAGWWRDVLLVQHQCLDMVVNVDLLTLLQEMAQGIPHPVTVQCLRSVQECQHHLDRNVNPRLALDVLMLSFPRVALQGQTT